MTPETPHVWDWRTSFCTACGCAVLDHVDRPRPCAGAPNVIAISHLIAARRLDDLLDAIVPPLVGG